MDKKIIVSLFETYERAHGTADRLEAAGFNHDDVSVIDQDSARTRSWSSATSVAGITGSGYGIAGAAYAPRAAYAPMILGTPGFAAVPAAGIMAASAGAVEAGGTGTAAGGTSYASDRAAAADTGDIAEWLSGEGVDEDDAHAYAEGVRRGGTLLAVKCGETDVDRAVSIIDNDGALDIDERQSAWRNEGWAGRDQITPGRDDAGTKGAISPAAERGLHVGQRQLDHGRVRIHSPRTATPDRRSEP